MMDESESGVQAEAPAPGTERSMGAKRAIAIAVVYFLAQLLIGIGFGIAAGVYLGITLGETDPAIISEAMVPLTLPISMFGVVVAGLIAFRMTRRTLRGPIGRGALASLGWRPSAASGIAVAMFTGCALSLVYLLILVQASPPAEGQQWGPLATAALSGGWQRILWAILALALAPPIEEFIFRGVLLSGLSSAIGIRTAALIVTVVFVMVHATETLGYWPAWVGLGLLASAVILFRIKTESLLPAVAVHTGYNLVLVLTAYLGSA